MARAIAISLLVIVVYSWEEVKYILRKLVSSFFPSSIVFHKGRGVDHAVGTLVILATVPMGLIFLFSSLDGVIWKIAFFAGLLILFAGLAITSEVLLQKGRYVAPLSALSNFISPLAANVLESGHLPRKILARFAFLMSLPIFAGLLVRLLNRASPEEIVWRLNILTTVLVGSIVLRLTIELLEHYFYLYNLDKLFSYYRVALGIALAAILLLS